VTSLNDGTTAGEHHVEARAEMFRSSVR